MKILYVTTVGATMGFFRDFIRSLLDEGHQVEIACNDKAWAVPLVFRDWGCPIHQIDFSRSPMRRANIHAMYAVKKLVREGHYDIVHCHTPVAAMFTRLACRRQRKAGLRVIYTAHGFHFFKGAPLKNWLIFYPVEWLCSFWTDVLITINKEDFALAKKHFHAHCTKNVHGVGIDIAQFRRQSVNRIEKRAALGIPADAFLVLSVGELNHNKNHETVLRAMAQCNDPNLFYMIAGRGELDTYLEQTALSLGLQDHFRLLGFRNDVPELYKAADLFVHPSFREGLPVSVMEAIASGLPVLCSDIRGARELTLSEQRFQPDNASELANLIGEVKDGKLNRTAVNLETLRSYDNRTVIARMWKIYDNYYVKE